MSIIINEVDSNTNAASTNQESVLCFYEINADTSNLTFNEVWEKFIISKKRNVFCRQVFHFDMQPEMLSEMLSKTSKRNKRLLRDIKAVRDNFADYMFVQPTYGAPINGFHIDAFLKKFDM